MALQRINWTQIDTLNIPTGVTVNLGSLSTPLDGVTTDVLFIQGVDFFAWLQGYTGGTVYYAVTNGPNIFEGSQTINGGLYINSISGNSITANYPIIVSGSTGSADLNTGYLILRGPNNTTGIPYIALLSNNPLDPSGLYMLLNGLVNDINPIDGPTITQLTPSGETQTIIGFQSLSRWTYGDVTFYTPVHMSSGLTVTGNTYINGNVDITGEYLINGQPSGFITNTCDVWTGTDKVICVVTLSQAEYDAIGTKNANILYIII
jgi:hypothetical protein